MYKNEEDLQSLRGSLWFWETSGKGAPQWKSVGTSCCPSLQGHSACICQNEILYTLKTSLTSLLNVRRFVFKCYITKLFISVLLDWQQTAAKCLNLWEKLHDFVFVIKGIPLHTVKSNDASCIHLLS